MCAAAGCTRSACQRASASPSSGVHSRGSGCAARCGDAEQGRRRPGDERHSQRGGHRAHLLEHRKVWRGRTELDVADQGREVQAPTGARFALDQPSPEVATLRGSGRELVAGDVEQAQFERLAEFERGHEPLDRAPGGLHGLEPAIVQHGTHHVGHRRVHGGEHLRQLRDSARARYAERRPDGSTRRPHWRRSSATRPRRVSSARAGLVCPSRRSRADRPPPSSGRGVTASSPHRTPTPRDGRAAQVAAPLVTVGPVSQPGHCSSATAPAKVLGWPRRVRRSRRRRNAGRVSTRASGWKSSKRRNSTRSPPASAPSWTAGAYARQHASRLSMSTLTMDRSEQAVCRLGAVPAQVAEDEEAAHRAVRADGRVARRTERELKAHGQP